MSSLRTFLLWALMLAVPFQGYAAASMLGCAPGSSPVAASMDALADDHAAHGHHAAQAPADAAVHDHGAVHADTGHTCGTCGICHAVALVGPPAWGAAQPLPPADLGEPARPVATHVLRVLDRPPRA
ncbi:hypothetical protein [Pseudorhodoferax sp. Leaf267]|uniref:hypothetical protein n=1 Tax=Pseudorhodoferax sp. Leaf267 TaxID=1736316 RepID=UPI0007126D7B|nr:hypothetical protein [Pseudorhodoferax sp. Leaf267]KQP22713.1 hypothetical protein ASF43_02045 [Pseudorhodoferax sp. Leaf267]